MSDSDEFIVETHERIWGVKRYPHRPSLSNILSSTVVVFWKDVKQSSWKITLHDDLSGIEAEYKRILFR